MRSSRSRLLNLPEDSIPGCKASAPLAKDPHRDGEQADEDVQAADGREDFEGTLLGDPVCSHN